MKRLILMRHAKSSWASEADSDHARPLNDRGLRQAPRVGALLAERGWVPDRVLCSDALRTRQTWDCLRPALAGGAPHVSFEPTLYLAGWAELKPLLAGSSHTAETVLALGHNPGWEAALAQWAPGEPELKTSWAALLEAPDAESWEEVVGRTRGFRWVETVVPDVD
ncbi:MAG TPA: histidine phosphatase family protein [Myxococcales bacterium LLY-WYZ-16_1]|jgi:phosphohistidine phosphatase|nr:histidine phosphatase family protein [Myxococcales bacterium LLY-WYZ-16_1]